MLNRCLILFFVLVLNARFFGGEPNKTSFSAIDYISVYKAKAVNEMLVHGIPASITLAQGMLESGNGNSDLAVNANNHFGIKCHKEWCGPSFIKDDDEKNECFRKYENVSESYNDHSLFLKTRPRYAFLFQLAKTDYVAWAKGLKSAGYATHPEYAEKLIDLIEKNKLFELDTLKSLIPEFFAQKREEKKFYNTLSLKTKQLVELIRKFDLNSLKEERFANSISERLRNLYLPGQKNASSTGSLVNDSNSNTVLRNSGELSPDASTETKTEVKTKKVIVFAGLDSIKTNCYNYLTSIHEINTGVQFFVTEKNIANCKNVFYTTEFFSFNPVKINTAGNTNRAEGISLLKINSQHAQNSELYSENTLINELQSLCISIVW